MIDRFHLPDFLFQKKSTQTLSSSTVAAFCPEKAVMGSQDSFKTRLIPSSEEDNYQRMTVLINDQTMPYACVESALSLAYLYRRMLRTGFAVYIIKKGKARLVTSVEMITQGDVLTDEEALFALVKGQQIPADDIVVCNFNKNLELQNYYLKYKIPSPNENIVDFTSRGVERLEQAVVNQWRIERTFPEGIPPIVLNPEVLDEMKRNPLPALADSKLLFKVCTKHHDILKAIPPEKIVHLDFLDPVEKEPSLSFPKLQSIAIDFFNFDIKSLGVIEASIGSTRSLEKVKIRGGRREHYQLYESLGEIETIESLCLDQCDLSRGGFDFKKMVNVRYLSIFSLDSDVGHFKEIGACLRNLIFFEMRGRWNDVAIDNFQPEYFSSLRALIYTSKSRRCFSLWSILSNAKTLEYLKLSINDSEILSKIDQFSFGDLKTLVLSRSQIEDRVLIAILKKTDHLENLILEDVVITGTQGANWKGLMLNRLKRIHFESFTLRNDREGEFFTEIFRATPILEDLHYFKKDDSFSVEFSFNCPERAFEKLKVLDLSFCSFNSVTLSKILKQAKSLKQLDLSRLFQFDAVQNCDFLIDPRISFSSLEVFSMNFFEMSAEFLHSVLVKMPTLLILGLQCVQVNGRLISPLPNKSLVQLSLDHSKFQDDIISELVTGNRFDGLSYLSTNKMILNSSLDFDVSILLRISSPCNITLIHRILSHSSGFRYLWLSDVEGEVDSNELLTRNMKFLTELSLNTTVPVDPRVLDLIRFMPNLSVDGLNTVSRYKRSQGAGAKNSGECVDDPQEDASQNDQIVYGGINSASWLSSPLRYYDESQTYYHSPMFKVINRRVSNLRGTRNEIKIPIFDVDDQTIHLADVPVNLVNYEFPKNVNRQTECIEQRFPHEVQFQDPAPDLNLHDPWIRLIGLTPNDILLNAQVMQGVDSIKFSTHFCLSTRFYYLLLHDDDLEKASAIITISYEISPQFPTIVENLPASIKEVIKPFSYDYDSVFDSSILQKSLLEQLQDILDCPDPHHCANRTFAFLYAMSEEHQCGTIDGYLYCQNDAHAWAEILFSGEWYTIDLGGSPDYKIIFSNESKMLTKKRSLPAGYTVAPLSLRERLRDAPAPEIGMKTRINEQLPTVQKVVHESPTDKLLDQLSSQQLNMNLLIVCKKSRDHRYLNMIRRYLRSLAPEHTTVIDDYNLALSSLPFIKVNDNSWEPVLTLDEPQGWLAERMLRHPVKQKRLVIDWSSLSASQGTKLNSCIDLHQRRIDDLPIDPDVQVVGLICDDDPRLEDSSFMSRFAGHVINSHLFRIPDNPIVTQDVLNIDLFHSSRWRQLLIGRLAFDHEGNPVHLKKELLGLKNSHHLVINNPPLNDKDFVRFIHDLQDGFSFRYFNTSIKLSRMNVTLTHGYHFEKIKNKIVSVNWVVRSNDHDLIHIDHVVTPSTFERCLETHRIVNGKLLTSAGWLSQASADRPLKMFITRTLSEEQYNSLFSHVPNASLRLFVAPDVELPREISEEKYPEFEIVEDIARKKNKLNSVRLSSALPIVIDVTELAPDDLFSANHFISHPRKNKFIFFEKISDVWRELKRGGHVVLTGKFSPEIIDHLISLLLPQGYLWIGNEKVSFLGKITLQPSHPIPSLSWVDPKVFEQIVTYETLGNPTRIEVYKESERQAALLKVLENYPFALIEGVPGIGKSCFIRSLKENNALKCYSFCSHDLKSLKAWATSRDECLTLLLIDEATTQGTDWLMFSGLRTARKMLLIDQKLYRITSNKKVVFIGNRLNKMPALFTDDFPVLEFAKLTKNEVIDNILTPIFAEDEPFTAKNRAIFLYDPNYSVRELQSMAISQTANRKYYQEPELSTAAYTREKYVLPDSRMEIFHSLIDMIKSRRFMREATAEPARFGGQTGHFLVGLPASGKSEIIHAAFHSKHYDRITDLSRMSSSKIDHTFCYYHIPATCDTQHLRQYLKHAFAQGCIVMIDELDAVLKGDTPEEQAEIQKLIAELNAYLMGEDLQGVRPKQSGFTLMATGNGIKYHGRSSIPASLASRLKIHEVQPYTLKDCRTILADKFPGVPCDDLILKYLCSPNHYTFRQLLADSDQLMKEHKRSATTTTITFAYHAETKSAFGVTIPQSLDNDNPERTQNHECSIPEGNRF